MPPDQISFTDRRTTSNPMMFSGGVDPGITKAGYALVVSGTFTGGCQVLDCGVINDPAGGGIASVFDRWYDLATIERGGMPALLLHVGVEGQWIPKIDASVVRNPKKLKAIMGQINSTVGVAANRGAWVALAQARGWVATVEHPSQWRRGLNRAGSGSGKRKPLKDAAIEAIRLRERQLFRKMKMPKRIPDHLAEAILIAEYRAKKQQMFNLTGDES